MLIAEIGGVVEDRSLRLNFQIDLCYCSNPIESKECYLAVPLQMN